MRVIIVGMGDIGVQLASDLTHRSGIELVLIDDDKKKCEELAGDYDALVLNGDGTDPELLKKANIDNADALVATTESDALNTVIALLGKRFSVPKIIIKLNEMGLRTACEEMGVDHIISPKISAATEITSLLHGYDILDFSILIRGGARLTQISPGKMGGKELKEIDLPNGALIITVLRDEEAYIPKGETKILKDDTLIILVENEKTLDSVKEIFGG